MVTTMQATRKRGKRQPRKDEQQAQQEATHQQETPTGELPQRQAPQGEQLAKPATAEQKGGPALRPTQPFAMRFWIMTDSESYLLTPVRRKLASAFSWTRTIQGTSSTTERTKASRRSSP